jgi:predicted HTH domain antitoxin
MTSSQVTCFTIQLPKEIAKSIDDIVKQNGSNSSEVIRILLALGLESYRIKRALDLYKKGQVSITRAAEIAQVPVEEILENMIRDKIPCQVYTADLREIHKVAARQRVEYYRMLEELGKE